MLKPPFLIQLLSVIILVYLSARMALHRFQWTMAIAWIYGAAVLGVYLSLSYLLREETWVRAYLIPAAVVLVGVGFTMALAEQFWRQYRAVQTQLIQAEKMASLGKLAAGVAHEMNNPVGAANSSSDVSIRCIKRIIEAVEKSESLDELKNNEQFHQLIKTLKNNNQVAATATDRIVKIVNSLKNFSRLDEAEFQKVDIHEGLKSTLTLIDHQIRDRVTVITECGQIPEIYCYPGQLNQVFMNLLINASQAIEDKGTIKIETSSDDANVYVKISDTGRGIPSERLESIFDPNFSTKSSRVGMSLGLSTSYNIVHNHGGDIKVESQVGVGTTFTITLPIYHNGS